MKKPTRLLALLLLALAFAPPAPAAEPPALRRVGPADLPDLGRAFEGRDEGLLTALDRSLAWFDGPGSRAVYPFAPLGLTHQRARAGAAAFRELLTQSPDGAAFARRVADEFEVWASVGADGAGAVLFTGYYSPVFPASRTGTEVYRFPLYRRPPDLVNGDGIDRVLGRRVGGRLEPYPTRAEIERDPAGVGLAGLELAWLASDLDRFLVHVQGSARLAPVDGGQPLDLAFAGTNGREYTSIGRLLTEDRKIEKGKVDVPAIRAYFREHPEELDRYLNRNDRYVFFREAEPEAWPTGALGFPVTPLRSLATDKALFPRGGVVLVDTPLADPAGEDRPFVQFLLDQDAGGAIRTPGRADIYVGAGDEAGEVAGRQARRGRLYYFLLKPERVAAWAGGKG